MFIARTASLTLLAGAADVATVSLAVAAPDTPRFTTHGHAKMLQKIGEVAASHAKRIPAAE
ncbi:MAG: hypothetical protein H2060_03160 [Azoarcus sp.]|nr:hypothetical protein [Azoarcus sp.]